MKVHYTLFSFLVCSKYFKIKGWGRGTFFPLENQMFYGILSVKRERWLVYLKILRWENVNILSWGFFFLFFIFPQFFIIVKCMWHKIYHLNHFQVHSSVVSNIFTPLGNHHHPPPKLFPSCKTETPYPLNTNSPCSLSPSPGNYHSSL